jgi:hypothetical protein
LPPSPRSSTCWRGTWGEEARGRARHRHSCSARDGSSRVRRAFAIIWQRALSRFATSASGSSATGRTSAPATPTSRRG